MTQNYPNQVKENDKLKDKRIWEVTRQKQLVTYKGSPIRLWPDFSTETLQETGIGMKYSNWWKAMTYNQGYFTQQGYHLKLKEK